MISVMSDFYIVQGALQVVEKKDIVIEDPFFELGMSRVLF